MIRKPSLFQNLFTKQTKHPTDYKKRIDTISTYFYNPSLCPDRLLNELIIDLSLNNFVHPIKLKTGNGGLLFIGGEAIIILAKDFLGKEVLIKVSRILDKIGASKQRLVNRFQRGLIIQELIYNALIQNKLVSDTYNRPINALVPRVFTFSRDPLFCVMEKVNGLRITEYFKNENIDINKRLVFFHYLLDFVEFCFSQGGIIHRDLKCDNILIGLPPSLSYGNLILYIVDWGYGKVAGETGLTMVHEGIGTPGFSSYKQNTNMIACGIKDEIYSLGLVLWEFVTLQRPPNIKSLEELTPEYMLSYNKKLMEMLPTFLKAPFWKARETELKRLPSVQAFRQILKQMKSEKQEQLLKGKIDDKKVNIQYFDKSNNTCCIVDLKPETTEISKPKTNTLWSDIKTSKYKRTFLELKKLGILDLINELED